MLDHVKTVGDSIQIATGVLSTLNINPEKMKASLEYVISLYLPIPSFLSILTNG